MDAMELAIVRRTLAGLTPAADSGRGLDAALLEFLTGLTGLPGLSGAAVVLADADNPPTIRARTGSPDVGVLLGAALERGAPEDGPRLLRPGRAPVAAEAASLAEAAGDATAMLAAPIVAGEDMPWGWLFAGGLLGPSGNAIAAARLLPLFAEVAAGLVRATAVCLRREEALAREVVFLRSKVSLRYRHVFSDGESPLLETLRAAVDRAALSDGPVVLAGEDGSGRGVLARLIHELSPRGVRLFSVFDPTEEEQPALRLFGGSGGMGAAAVSGLIEETDGGTLVIKQAHRLPRDVWEQLAGYLAGGTFTRQGGARPRHSRTRLLFTAPPKGLGPERTTAAMTVITVPGLREHREDIPALLDHLLAAESTRSGRRLTLTPKAMKALEAYDWPGNIREMRTLVTRLAATVAEDRIDIADIPPEMLAEGERPPVLPEDAAELRDMERQQVLSALNRHGWVQSRAARELGLTLRQIGYRIRKYGLSRDENSLAG